MKKILLTNGRSPITLDFVRNLASLGHEVYVAETESINFCRFSNAVKKSFVLPSPHENRIGYLEALAKIALDEKIDLFMPMWEDGFLISNHIEKFPPTCRVFVGEGALLHTLQCKWSFIKYAEELGFPIPKTKLLRAREDLDSITFPDYALKACISRGSGDVYRVRDNTPRPNVFPSTDKPWVAQEWLEGKIFCTYSVCEAGVVRAHAAYPMDFVKEDAGSYCLSFAAVNHPAILAWTKKFVALTNYSGQIAFDFIELKDGTLYPIECNPRMTSGITLFTTDDRIDKAFFGKEERLITPKEGYQRQMLFPMLFFGWQTAYANKKLKKFFQNFFSSKDLIFNKRDLKPFLVQPIFLFKSLKDSYKYKKKIPSAFTHTLDYEPVVNQSYAVEVENVSR